MPGMVSMEKTLTSGRVAHLLLQPVLPVCDDAIKQFRRSKSIEQKYSIKAIEDPTSNVYAWIDSDLFTEALTILFKDLLNCPGLNKNINVHLKQIGLSTCRIIIAHSENPDLSICDGPFSLPTCPWHDYDIEDSQIIVSMHGGYIQTWKMPETSRCFFEINLICMSGNGEENYDRI
jgi:hypothetical protein